MDAAAGPSRGEPKRWRRYRTAAAAIAFSGRQMSDDELLDAIDGLRVGRLLTGPLAFATGTLLLVFHGGLLLLTNWRLVLVELVPAVWLAAILWDWRFHVLYRNDLVRATSWDAVIIAVVAVAMTIASYWCNVTFVYLVSGREEHVRPALRAVARHRHLVAGVGLAVGSLHAWVAARGPIWGVPTFALGLAIVACLNLYFYSTLPAQALGLDRGRLRARDAMSRALTVGALGVVVAVPGILLALIGRGLLEVPAARALGVIALALAVLVQVAATSSSRALSLATVVATSERQPQAEPTNTRSGAPRAMAPTNPGRNP